MGTVDYTKATTQVGYVDNTHRTFQWGIQVTHDGKNRFGKSLTEILKELMLMEIL
jgi:predicted NAD-dependent protein-ADP-ribosyltransferase YbiA (DUF1768 family)